MYPPSQGEILNCSVLWEALHALSVCDSPSGVLHSREADAEHGRKRARSLGGFRCRAGRTPGPGAARKDEPVPPLPRPSGPALTPAKGTAASTQLETISRSNETVSIPLIVFLFVATLPLAAWKQRCFVILIQIL